MDTQFAFPGTPAYNSITSQSGVAEYSAGTQADRTAKALALVKKWYPTASDSNAVVKLKFGFASTSGVRVTISKLVKAQMAKIGFDVDIAGSADWLGDTSPEENSEWDISMYAFQLSSLTPANATEVYKSDGGNNNWGWSNSTLDTIATSLQSDYLTSAQVLAKRIAADKIVHDNYWGLPLYQNVSLIAYTKSLVGVKPSPLSPSVVWNYWEWHY
jgi:peptide/nickel transport system substrate-binding protein